ncbi:MAG: S1 RNA-binding domain-containing protein [Deltaproteobacteria bacterium]|nr:S1 RNA-binding domain-containing protein [Deltaproteobacteria bacterium]
MDFAELLKRINSDLYDHTDKQAIAKVSRFLEKSKGLTGLLKSENPVLNAFPQDKISDLSIVFFHFTRWKDAYRNTKRNLAVSQKVLPDKSVQNAAFPHELRALERTAPMCPRAGYPDVSSWQQSVDAHVTLFNDVLNSALQTTLVTVKSDNPLPEELALQDEIIINIIPKFWLNIMGRLKDNKISIKFKFDEDLIKTKIKTHLPMLGLAAQKRSIDDIMDELILPDLENTILDVFYIEQKTNALSQLAQVYEALLLTAPVRGKSIISIYNDNDNISLAVILKGGKIIYTEDITDASSIEVHLDSLIKEHEPSAIVIPDTYENIDQLNQFIEKFESITVKQIYSQGIEESSSRFSFSNNINIAVSIGIRAMYPLREFSQINPQSLGLEELNIEATPEEIDDILLETKFLAQYKIKRGPVLNSKNGVPLKKRRLNPNVKTIRDLQPGMILDGIITNLTKFGAFVNIGLTTEAMIHVSQLSTDFIEEPSQIVTRGQIVKPRVLEVIPDKGRIALTLKPEGMDNVRVPSESKELRNAKAGAASLFRDVDTSNIEHSQGSSEQRTLDSSNNGNSQTSRDPAKKSRNEALADLDALFKK